MRVRTLTLVLTAATSLLFASPAAAAQPGSLDSGFSGDGYRVLDLGRLTEPYAIFPNDDGGFTVAGEWRYSYYVGKERPQTFLMKFHANGQLDVRFGEDGVALIDAFAGQRQDGPHGWARDAAGRYLVVGILPGVGGYYLQRVRANGNIDQSFGNEGIATFPRRKGWYPSDVVVHGDGRIIVLGGDYETSYIRAHHPDGSLDRSFGDNGTRRVGNYEGHELFTDGSGRVFVTGMSRSRFIVRALKADGSSDRAYGRNGRAASPELRDSGYLSWGGGELLSDGAIALTGRETFGYPEHGLLVRFDADGQPDRRLGNGRGWMHLPLTDHYFGDDLVELPNGRLAISGYWAKLPYDHDGRRTDRVYVAALEPDGDLWRPFANGGIFRNDFGYPGEAMYLGLMAIVGDDLVVAAAIDTYDAVNVRLVVARLNLN